MDNKTKALDEIIEFRRAVRVFDKDQEIDTAVVKKCVERAVLSPNSSNLQLWEFLHIQSLPLRSKLVEACLSQNAAKTAKDFVVILVRRDLWQQRCNTIVAQQSAYFREQSGGELTKKHIKLLSYWTKIIPLLQKSGFGLLDLFKKGMATFQGIKRPILREVSSKDLEFSAHRSVALGAQTFMMALAAEGYDSCPMEGIDTKRIRKLLDLPKAAKVAMVIGIGKRAEKGIYSPRFRVPFEEVYKVL